MSLEPTLETKEPLFRGRVFAVERLHLSAGGHGFTREVARHPGAAAALAYDGNAIVLVSQWRAPFAREVLEVPAGTRDVPGEAPVDTARRELAEEAGLAAGSLEPLVTLFNSPGWSDQITEVFLATDLREVDRSPDGPEEAASHVVRLPLADAVALALAPSGCDATTAASILALAIRQR